VKFSIALEPGAFATVNSRPRVEFNYATATLGMFMRSKVRPGVVQAIDGTRRAHRVAGAWDTERVPNGTEGSLRRLEIACAAFRQRHGTWPSQARLGPHIVYDVTHILDIANWNRVCSLITIRTTQRANFAVGDGSSHLVYEKLREHPSPEAIQAASEWLGLEIDPRAWGDHD
jgi:hypothetical protein